MPSYRSKLHHMFTAALLLVTLALLLMPSARTYAAITVNSPLDNETDDAVCTLREAILTVNGVPPNANCVGTTEEINFTPGLDILVDFGAPLPALIANGITITGNLIDSTDDIIIRGTATAGDGLTITGADNSINNLILLDFPGNGIVITGTNATNNRVTATYIGFDFDGNPGGTGGSGIVITNGAADNQIGDATDADARVFVGATGAHGIALSGADTSNNTIANTFVGTDNNNSFDFGSTLDGIRLIAGASNNNIGVDAAVGPFAGNVIAFNNEDGITVSGTTTTGNTLQNNVIGATFTGPAPNTNGIIISAGANNTLTQNNQIVNNTASGIVLSGADTSANAISSNLIQGNQVGITINNDAADNRIENGNTISANLSHGISISDAGTLNTRIDSNTIDSNGGAGIHVLDDSSGTTITQNSLFNNAALGIDLGGDGVTANDADDADTGPNDLQNFPLLTAAINNGVETALVGTMPGAAAEAPFDIEIFNVGPAPDPSGQGEGQTYVEALTGVPVQAAPVLLGILPAGTTGTISSTATSQSTGSTSEFSNNVLVEDLLANFTRVPNTGLAPLTVTFTDTSVGNISAWAWDFDDGNTSTQQNPVHTFITPGIYQVTLTITHTSGLITSQRTRRVTVEVPPPTPIPPTPIPPTLEPPTPTMLVPSDTPTNTLVPTATASSTATATPTNTATATLTNTATATETSTLVPTETETLIPTATVTASPSPTPTPTTTLAIGITKEPAATDAINITVNNDGDTAIEDLVVQEILRQGVIYLAAIPGEPICEEDAGVITCRVGTILGGQSLQITIVVDSDGTAITSGTTIISAPGQTRTLNEPYVAKFVQPPFATIGEEVTFTIRIINPTDETVTGVSLTDQMPNAIDLISATASSGTIRTAGRSIRFSQASLGPGGRITLTIVGTLLESDDATTEVVNNACLLTDQSSEVCASTGFLRAQALPQTGESQRSPLMILLPLLGIAAAASVLLRQRLKSSSAA